jgi:ribA/ribD-fused uncharacterized protein
MAPNEMTETDKFVFFWRGPFSQWHKSKFSLDGVEYNCAEQGMMALKARHFGDAKSHGKIMGTNSPRDQKAAGRGVTPFDEGEWRNVCEDYVYRVNLAKFSSNRELRELLLSTGIKILAEASPVDKRWGIGLTADDPRAQDIDAWQGENLLGECLMRVRITLEREHRSSDKSVKLK